MKKGLKKADLTSAEAEKSSYFNHFSTNLVRS